MPTSMSVEDFIRDFSQARSSLSANPVFITQNGRNEGVYMSYEAYQQLTAGRQTLADAIGYSDAADIELELPARTVSTHRDVAF